MLNREGRFVDTGCFARYSDTPFFSDNQTIDITNFLKGHSSKVPIIAASLGGLFFFLVLASGLLYCRWKEFKKIKEGEDAPELKGAVNYNYKHLQLATNNFSEENSIGRGGFGEVFKACGVLRAVEPLNSFLASLYKFTISSSNEAERRRYSTFLILYPTGISSEIGMIYNAMPYMKESGKYSVRMPNKSNFSFDYFYFAIVVLTIYVPGRWIEIK